MTRYQAMSEADEERKLKEARRFAKGLFFNIKEDPDRCGGWWCSRSHILDGVSSGAVVLLV
jgi:hypothetical protein